MSRASKAQRFTRREFLRSGSVAAGLSLLAACAPSPPAAPTAAPKAEAPKPAAPAEAPKPDTPAPAPAEPKQ